MESEDFTPKVLATRPELHAYEIRMLVSYLQVSSLRPVGMEGPGTLTLRELDLHLSYYPVYDEGYFIDLMLSIEKERRRINRERVSSKGQDRRLTSREGSPTVKARIG